MTKKLEDVILMREIQFSVSHDGRGELEFHAGEKKTVTNVN